MTLRVTWAYVGLWLQLTGQVSYFPHFLFSTHTNFLLTLSTIWGFFFCFCVFFFHFSPPKLLTVTYSSNLDKDVESWINTPNKATAYPRRWCYQGFWTYLYFRIRHSFAHVWTILNKMASFGIIAHVWTILNKMASFGVNIYRPSASEHGQNITNITMI